MNEDEQVRFDNLRNSACVPTRYITEYYGLPWPLPEDMRPDFEAWTSQLPRRVSCGEAQVSRYEVETFMQKKDVVPKKWMGARLGMTVESLNELLNGLPEIGMSSQRYVVYADLIAESLSEDLVLNFPRFRFCTFSDHNARCTRLHAEVEQVLKIKVEPLYCATSLRIGEAPRQFANNFDCITLEPLSGKHQMWLDFRKPLNLGPDRCSKLFYVENRNSLGEYFAGTQEPDDLDEYVRFLGGQTNA